MKYALSLAAVVAASTIVMAAPAELNRRQYSNMSSNSSSGQTQAYTDTDVLNLALSLELLESDFYQQGLANYTAQDFQDAGLPAAFYNNLQTVAFQEETHVSFLQSALGSAAVQACRYTFPSTDPASFLQFAATVENVGTSAYLGGAALITNKEYLTEAGSILTVEARHTAYLRYARSFLTNAGEIPTTEKSPFPSPFDIPLSPSEAYTIASANIVPGSCPDAVPFTIFPSLSLVGGVLGSRAEDPVMTGSAVELATGADFSAQGESLMAAWPTAQGPLFTTVSETSEGYSTTVPAGINGQAYVVLVNSESVSDATIVAGPAIVQVDNPTLSVTV